MAPLLILLASVVAAAGAADEILARHPGCAAGVLHRDRVVFTGGAGGATPQSPFYLASLSKQFTAASIYALAAEGRLRLDAPVAESLPGLPPSITIRHLLHHTSGLRDYAALQEIAGNRDPLNNAGVLAWMLRQRDLNFPPGAGFEYSNSGYALLGLLAERATGMSLDSYARRRIFAPLGMAASRFQTHPNPGIPPTVGDGGMYSTVDDLLRWLRAWRRPPAHLRPALHGIWNRATLTSGQPIDHASGLFHGAELGLPSLSHNGQSGDWSSGLLHFPASDLSVVCLCRLAPHDAWAIGRELAAAFLHRSPPAPPAPAREDPAPRFTTPVAPFVSSYRNDDLDIVWSLIDGNNTLHISTPAGWRIPLRHVAPDQFTVGPWTLDFERDSSGRILGFALRRERVRRLPFTRLSRPAPASAATSRP